MSQEAIVFDTARGSMGSRSLLRRMNSLGIFRAVMDGPQTMRALAAHSRLSRTAIDSIVSDLVEMGWLIATESTPPGQLGRPASSFGLKQGLGYFLSIDVGANHIYAVVTDLAGSTLGCSSTPVKEDIDAEERVAAALAVTDELLSSLKLSRDSVWLVAIGSPGAIGRGGEVLYFGGTGMPGWIGLNLRERFSREFDTSILVEGDVALGAHAELAIGAAKGHNDVVYILCGIRTSGASIVDGKVHRGVHGAAGIVGEMPELKWAELNEQYGLSVLSSPRPSRQQIFEAARSGDATAIIAVDEFADDLATGAAAMTLAFDPELLVIGGGSAPGADVFLPRFEKSLREICPLPPTVVVSQLGSEAVAMGGISLAASHLSSVLEEAVRERTSFPSPGETLRLMRHTA
jgi:predicted NBD/HSP70 family sugar kinase